MRVEQAQPVSHLRAVLVILAMTTGTALAESGIRIKSGPTQISHSDDPPCDSERITRFKMVIENTNDVCNEYVKIWASERESEPLGGFKFLGFSKTEGGTLHNEIEYADMEDESTETFYFEVRTQPAAHVGGLGTCEFVSGGITIFVCDHDGGCDYGASADDPCRPIICMNSGTDCGEEPGPWPRDVALVGDQTNCPPPDTGTGVIRGLVSNPQGGPAGGARITVKRVLSGNIGCQGIPEFVRKSTRAQSLPLDERGMYEVDGLPFPPGEYEISAQDLGRCATQTVMIPPSGELTVNLTLSPGCP